VDVESKKHVTSHKQLHVYNRACFKVQWCTKCAVTNRNVQRWKAVCAVPKKVIQEFG